MSNWKPTEGLRRADLLVEQIATEAKSGCDVLIPAPLHWRMIEVLSQALDQALADGAGRDALDKVTGNGHAPLERVGSDVAWEATNPFPFIQVEAGDRTGSDEPPEPVSLAIPPENTPKKRGRPKGSKGKKAKVAKAVKKAEPEVVAEPVAVEAPAEEAAP